MSNTIKNIVCNNFHARIETKKFTKASKNEKNVQTWSCDL